MSFPTASWKSAVSLLVLSSTISLAHSVLAAPVVVYRATGEESIQVTRDPKTDEWRTRQVKVNFHPMTLSSPPYKELLAKETIAQDVIENTEGDFATARVDLFYRKSDKSYSAAPDHTTTVSEASRVAFMGDHWTATIFGCCDAEPLTQLFDYGKSKPFLYANGKYAQATLPNAAINRYVGVVLRSQSPTDEVERAVFGKNKSAAAAVLYGAPEGPLQKLFLQPKEGTAMADLPYHTLDVDIASDSPKDEIGYNEDNNVSKVLVLWSQDSLPDQPKPKSVSGLKVIASFSGNDGTTETVTIPINKDKFGTPRLSGQTMRVLKPE